MRALTDRTEIFVVARGEIPAQLQNGTIYVNSHGNRAHHLCACGCGNRVLTPLNKYEWRLNGPDAKPTLWPSVGNWNLECQSHYWVEVGKVVWACRWTKEEIAAGRAMEQRPYLKQGWWEAVKTWLWRIVAAFRK